MAGYKRAGPHKPTGGRGYFPHSPGTDHKRNPSAFLPIIGPEVSGISTDVPTIEQFHGMLENEIKRYSIEPTSDGFENPIIEGLEAALALFEGYFGYFGRKEEK